MADRHSQNPGTIDTNGAQCNIQPTVCEPLTHPLCKSVPPPPLAGATPKVQILAETTSAVARTWGRISKGRRRTQFQKLRKQRRLLL